MPRILTGIVILLLLAFGQATQAQKTSSADEQFVYVTVTDANGKWVGGLTADNFRLSEGKTVHAISSFSSAEEPVTVGLLIDTSGSSAKLMNDAYDGLAAFVRGAGKGAEYFVMTFDVGQRMALSQTANSNDVLQTLRSVAGITPAKNTAFFDALSTGLDAIATSRAPKKVLIVFSDATDNSSRLSFDAVRRKLRRSDVLLYGFNVMDESDAASMLAQQGIVMMDELTTLTGGRSMYPKDRSELLEASFRTAEELRYQYKIGFRPAIANSKSSNDWRKLDVKLQVSEDQKKTFGKFYVRARRGYYPDPTSVK